MCRKLLIWKDIYETWQAKPRYVRWSWICALIGAVSVIAAMSIGIIMIGKGYKEKECSCQNISYTKFEKLLKLWFQVTKIASIPLILQFPFISIFGTISSKTEEGRY